MDLWRHAAWYKNIQCSSALVAHAALSSVERYGNALSFLKRVLPIKLCHGKLRSDKNDCMTYELTYCLYILLERGNDAGTINHLLSCSRLKLGLNCPIISGEDLLQPKRFRQIFIADSLAEMIFCDIRWWLQTVVGYKCLPKYEITAKSAYFTVVLLQKSSFNFDFPLILCMYIKRYYRENLQNRGHKDFKP